MHVVRYIRKPSACRLLSDWMNKLILGTVGRHRQWVNAPLAIRRGLIWLVCILWVNVRVVLVTLV